MPIFEEGDQIIFSLKYNYKYIANVEGVEGNWVKLNMVVDKYGDAIEEITIDDYDYEVEPIPLNSMWYNINKFIFIKFIKTKK